MHGPEARRVVSRVEVVAPGRVDPAGLGEVALLLLFAYAGFENAAAPAGKYRDPKRGYISTAAEIPVLRKKLPDGPATMRLPFGAAIPIAAVVVSALRRRA